MPEHSYTTPTDTIDLAPLERRQPFLRQAGRSGTDCLDPDRTSLPLEPEIRPFVFGRQRVTLRGQVPREQHLPNPLPNLRMLAAGDLGFEMRVCQAGAAEPPPQI